MQSTKVIFCSNSRKQVFLKIMLSLYKVLSGERKEDPYFFSLQGSLIFKNEAILEKHIQYHISQVRHFKILFTNLCFRPPSEICDMVKHELRVTSCELGVQRLKAPVESLKAGVQIR